jgi:hypothetical protein
VGNRARAILPTRRRNDARGCPPYDLRNKDVDARIRGHDGVQTDHRIPSSENSGSTPSAKLHAVPAGMRSLARA